MTDHIREKVKIVYDIKTDRFVRLRSEWDKHLTHNINQIINSDRGVPIEAMKEEK